MKEKLMSVERANRLLIQFLAEGKEQQLLNNLLAVMHSDKRFAMSFFEESVKHFQVVKNISEEFLLVALENKNISYERISRLLNAVGNNKLLYLKFLAKEFHKNNLSQVEEIDYLNSVLPHTIYLEVLKKLLNLPNMNFNEDFIEYLTNSFRVDTLEDIEILETSSYRIEDIEKLIEIGCIEPCSVTSCSDRFTEEFLEKYRDDLIPFYLDEEKYDKEIFERVFNC